jgi:hypothetical protein
VVRLLQSIDPHALTDQPMAGPVANKVCVAAAEGGGTSRRFDRNRAAGLWTP